HSSIVRNCSVDSSSTGGASIAVIGNGVSVINNDVFNPGGDGITTSGGQGAGTPTQAYLIENNRVIAASAQGGAGISVPTENVIVKNNSIISMSTGVYFDGGLNRGSIGITQRLTVQSLTMPLLHLTAVATSSN